MAHSNHNIGDLEHTIKKSIDDLDPVLKEINKKVTFLSRTKHLI